MWSTGAEPGARHGDHLYTSSTEPGEAWMFMVRKWGSLRVAMVQGLGQRLTFVWPWVPLQVEHPIYGAIGLNPPISIITRRKTRNEACFGS